jgi:hypothetical protein|tara:strand:- start:208 stop:348 length:141 start_codon:yes stop_codon:yes gene_type:complete
MPFETVVGGDQLLKQPIWATKPLISGLTSHSSKPAAKQYFYPALSW